MARVLATKANSAVVTECDLMIYEIEPAPAGGSMPQMIALRPFLAGKSSHNEAGLTPQMRGGDEGWARSLPYLNKIGHRLEKVRLFRRVSHREPSSKGHFGAIQ